ncbi:hypothetical protein HG535_0C05540 [Zygotorulaspora mrakii]|uniref:Protein kinase domain-containing protein n=1 Tax=Zygotorulaspora mrakii TaxID=42260 RepID=A0A7H9B0P8_ZYGMR|nr:uncharacterized protein HG535_0C05540 [Zygotorulaspora mrakii]QLG72200.1 hypothetical protein HG535_0C05540 [Zygotorulaspora mrakii]
MNVDQRLRNPTLIPEGNFLDQRTFPFIEPPSKKLREDENIQSPSISYQSSRSSTFAKPTYHGIIEENTTYLIERIRPYVKEIVNENRHCLNEYTLISSIGHGQFSKVYKACSQLDKSIVAIKMISKKPWNNQQYSMNQTMRQIQLWKSRGLSHTITGDEAVKLMNVQKSRWEIYVLSKLSSPHVVLLQECLDSSLSKSIWIVNEWCNLGELKWRRRNNEQVHSQWEQFLPGCNCLSFAKRALIDLTQGLSYMKSQGCIHRDIKPSNILVDSTQNLLKISDFGCTILAPETLPFNDALLRDSFKAELNKIVGTPAFIAPELCKFEDHAASNIEDGFKLDIWSLGITMFSLLYNTMPFYGENEFDTYQKVTNSSLRSKINGEFLNDLVINRLLDKNPETRIDIEELTEIILPIQNQKNLKSESKKHSKRKTSVQNFLTKLFNGKSKAKNSPSVAHESSKREEITQNSNPSVQSSQFFDPSFYPNNSSSSSSSSYDEPIQVTDFMEPACVSLYGESQHDTEQVKSTNVLHNKSNRLNTSSGSEASESVSVLSISPIKIPTPIKALIRIKNSPNSKKMTGKARHISPLKGKSRADKENAKLAHSNDIINFQKYIHPKAQGEGTSKNKATVSTTEDIQEYLKYADDG